MYILTYYKCYEENKSGKEIREYSVAEGRVVVYKSLVFLKK